MLNRPAGDGRGFSPFRQYYHLLRLLVRLLVDIFPRFEVRQEKEEMPRKGRCPAKGQRLDLLDFSDELTTFPFENNMGI